VSLWSRQSLAVKLPIVLTLLLLLAVTTVSVASYLELRREVVGLASGRLQQAAEQMAAVFGTAGRQRVTSMQQLMKRPEVLEYLRNRDAALVIAIHTAARAYLGTAANIANVELWDPSGRRLLAWGAEFDEVSGALLEDLKRELQAVDAPAIGRLRHESAGLFYPVGGRVAHDGAVIGYVIERRRISNPAQTRQTVALLTGLIGGHASMAIGNADGSAWSDLTAPLGDVPITAAGGPHLWEYQRAGMPRTFAWATPINTTPWMVAIEFPRDNVLEPLQRLVVRLVAIAATLLLVGAAVAWVISRRITTPLGQVMNAAEAVAESRHAVHVDLDREDEIGRLADSFNTMATKVEQGRLDLELRVELRTAELRAANKELEAFSYSVSHDLRAPLRAIAGFVQILEDEHGGQFDADARRALERVKANATRMGQLIDDLLTFSRIGRTTMTRQTVDLTALARAAADDAIAASPHPIDVVVEPLPPCYGEPALLQQVFANLLSNAVKFTARAPRAAVTVGTKTGDDGGTVYFVRDNGVGFDDRFAEKLFGVFQRLHRVNDFEGTGVGLAIVRRIITRHGGSVWAESKLNEGAAFYFTLPTAGTPE
jgi:signal transduction histidine kinase